jgi:hypothetical protein
MSHHLDSLNARKDVRLDISDLYVFRGEEGTVFVTNVNHSIAPEITGTQVPAGFHPEARYEFKIDTDRDAIEYLTYRITFGELGTTGDQTVELRQLTGAQASDPHAQGTLIAHGVTGRTITTDDGMRLWAGKAGDPFWIEPDVLHAIGHAIADGTRANLSSWPQSEARNLFAGHTVYAIVLEVPDAHLLPVAGPDKHIEVWALTSPATDAGG